MQSGRSQKNVPRSVSVGLRSTKTGGVLGRSVDKMTVRYYAESVRVGRSESCHPGLDRTDRTDRTDRVDRHAATQKSPTVGPDGGLDAVERS